MSDENPEQAGLEWQVGVWNRMSGVYLSEIDLRFAPVVEAMMTSARLVAGETVLDLGAGTGAVAREAARLVGPDGSVLAVDISPEMVSLARERAARLGIDNMSVREGRAESIPAEEDSFDVVLASLSLMFVIDRGAAAREIARVLKPGGRFVASVWAGPEECDIVLFQETAGRFSGPPPVAGVGPGSLADPSPFLRQLGAAGIPARVERRELGFEFPDFASAWDVLAGVTTAHLSADRQREAKAAVLSAVYPDGAGLRRFRNVTQFIVGRAAWNR